MFVIPQKCESKLTASSFLRVSLFILSCFRNLLLAMNCDPLLDDSSEEVTFFGQPYMPALDHKREYTLPSSRVRSGPTRVIARPDPAIWLELRLNQTEVKNNPQLWNMYVQQLQVVLGPEQGKTGLLTTVKDTASALH
jgi:hypothetical protein